MRMPQIFHVHCHPGQGWRSRKRSVNALSRRHSPSLLLGNVNRNGNVRRSMIIYQHSLGCGLWTFARTSSEANFARHKINDVKISRMLLELKFGWGTRGCGWMAERGKYSNWNLFCFSNFDVAYVLHAGGVGSDGAACTESEGKINFRLAVWWSTELMFVQSPAATRANWTANLIISFALFCLSIWWMRLLSSSTTFDMWAHIDC